MAHQRPYHPTYWSRRSLRRRGSQRRPRSRRGSRRTCCGSAPCRPASGRTAPARSRTRRRGWNTPDPARARRGGGHLRMLRLTCCIRLQCCPSNTAQRFDSLTCSVTNRSDFPVYGGPSSITAVFRPLDDSSARTIAWRSARWTNGSRPDSEGVRRQPHDAVRFDRFLHTPHSAIGPADPTQGCPQTPLGRRTARVRRQRRPSRICRPDASCKCKTLG